MRSPFADLARAVKMKPEEGDKLLEEVSVKMSYV